MREPAGGALPGPPPGGLNVEAQATIHELARSASKAREVDPRIRRAVGSIVGRLCEDLTLERVADEVHLSPGRFRHLFVEETELPFRRYVVWARLQEALRLAVAGTTWTEAAHAAHFADQAHLTRTFRDMFGVAPSASGRAAPASAVTAGLEAIKADR